MKHHIHYINCMYTIKSIWDLFYNNLKICATLHFYVILIRNNQFKENIAAKLSQHRQPCLSCVFVLSSKFIVSSTGSEQY